MNWNWMRAQVSCWNGSVTDRRMPAALRQLSCMGHPPGLAGRNIKSPRSRNSGVMPLQVCFPGFSAIRDMIPSARSAYWKNRIVHKMASGLLHKQPTSYKCAYPLYEKSFYSSVLYRYPCPAKQDEPSDPGYRRLLRRLKRSLCTQTFHGFHIRRSRH